MNRADRKGPDVGIGAQDDESDNESVTNRAARRKAETLRPSTAREKRYGATILHAREGKRLAKLYRDPSKPPLDYDAGNAFRAEEVRCKTFAEFVDVLASLPSDACIIRGRVREEARPVVEAGHHVARRAYDNSDDGIKAAFEPCRRRWLVLDVDKSETPFDVDDVAGSVAAFIKSLPRELRRAQKAFLLSASSHLSPTVRGKLVVELAKPLGNAQAEAYARSLGFDPCVSRTVQPNYFARPVFEGCEDPVAAHRGAILFRGKPAVLPRIDTTADNDREQNLGPRERTPVEVPPLSKRARKLLTPELRDHWLDGERMSNNAALHLFGWLLGKGWRKAEVAALLAELDSAERNRRKLRDHRRALNNARALEGPGAAKEWLGEHFARFDRTLHRDPVVQGYLKLAASKVEQDDDADDADEGGPSNGLVFGSLCEDPPRQTFLVPEFEIGVGRPWGWLGKTNASKTIAIQQLEVDLALGRPVFGRFGGPSKPVPVLHIAYEGFAKAAEDYTRLIRGTGEDVDWAELNERLKFAEGRKFLGAGDETREWLLRVTAPFGGGVCVIDPLVAACRGLDENTTEIAVPIYALESVSKANGVAFVVAHHYGHTQERARGSSAIEGAFGASASIAKVDGGDVNERTVTGGKRNRYGVPNFTLALRDVNEDGSPWDATPKAIRGGEVSWGLRVEATVGVTDTAPGVREAARMRTSLAAAAKHADAVVDLLKRADRMRQGMTARKIRGHLNINGTRWGDVRAELIRREAVEEYTLPSDSSVVMRLPKRRRDDDDDAEPTSRNRASKRKVGGA